MPNRIVQGSVASAKLGESDEDGGFPTPRAMHMVLSKTFLPPDVVSRLANFNIREVSQLMAMAKQPEGILGLTHLLGVSMGEFRALLERLRKEYPLEFAPPASERTPSFGLIETHRRMAE